MRPKEVFRHVKEAFIPYHLPELPKPPVGKLSRAEQAQYQRDWRAVKEVRDDFQHTRRVVVGGVLGAGGLIGTAVVAPVVVPVVLDALQRIITSHSPSSSDSRGSDASFPEGAPVPGAKEKMVRAINELPESAIKTALVSRVLPYFQEETPFRVNRSGLEFTVHAIAVTAKKTSEVAGDGTFTAYGRSVLPKDGLRTVETTPMKLPFPEIIKEYEIASVQRDKLAPDNTTLIVDIPFPPGAFIAEGVYPEIIITTPYEELLTPFEREGYRTTEPFAYVKEACSLLFVDILLEEMHKKAKELNLPTTIRTIDPQGNQKDVEVITTAYALSAQEGRGLGRIDAATDIAGYVIALKAFENTPVIRVLQNDDTYAGVIQMLPTIDLGTTPYNIWSRSFDLAIRRTELRTLQYRGDLKKIP